MEIIQLKNFILLHMVYIQFRKSLRFSLNYEFIENTENAEALRKQNGKGTEQPQQTNRARA